MGKRSHRLARFFTSLWRADSSGDDSTLSGSEESTLVEVDAICHIKRLPDPVLGAIFTLNKKAEPDVPVERVISHVAATWRVVALGYPELWSTINTRVQPEHQRALLRWYLAHSGGNPLDVRIGLSQETWRSGEGPQLLTDVLLQESRLRSLSIRSDFTGADKTLRAVLRHIRAPLLEHLSFIFLEQHDFDPEEIITRTELTPSVFVNGVPRLAVLRLQHLETTLYPPLRGVTTLHLEEYRCPPMAAARLKAFLYALPALANLSIYGDMVAHESWPELYLPGLRSLRSASNAQLGRLLVALNAPALKSLVLKDVRGYDLGHAFEPSQSLRLSGVRTLTIDGSLGARLSALFYELVGVEELWLVNLDADNALELIARREDGLLPALQRVMVHQVRDTVALDALYAQGAAVSVHVDIPWKLSGVERWTRLPFWPAEVNRADADDLFMQLRTRRSMLL